jgi:hypothetical protein
VEKTAQIQVIVFLNDKELAVFGVVTPEDQLLKAASPTLLSGKSHSGNELRNQPKSELNSLRVMPQDQERGYQSRGRTDSVGPQHAHTLSATEAKEKKQFSPAPRRVFSINNGPLADQKDAKGVIEEPEKDGKTDRTQLKYRADPNDTVAGDSRSKIESDGKQKSDQLFNKAAPRSYSVHQKKDLNQTAGSGTGTKAQIEGPKVPPAKANQLPGPIHNLITTKDLIPDAMSQKDAEKGKIDRLIKMSRQNTAVDETKNDGSDFFFLGEVSKDLPSQPPRSQNTSGTIPVVPQVNNTLAFGLPGPEISQGAHYTPSGILALERFDSATTIPQNSAPFAPKTKPSTFFAAFTPILGQAQDYSAFVNENTRAIHELYKPLPTSAPQVKRISKDSMEFWKNHRGSFQERANEDATVYARAFDRNVEEADRTRQLLQQAPAAYPGSMSGGNGPSQGYEVGQNGGNGVKIVRLNSNVIPSQRPDFLSQDTDVKMASGGLNFRRLGTQNSNQLDSNEKK